MGKTEAMLDKASSEDYGSQGVLLQKEQRAPISPCLLLKFSLKASQFQEVS